MLHRHRVTLPGAMPHRLYANGAISVNSAVASGRQVEPLTASMAFPLKCMSSSPHPPSVTEDVWRYMCILVINVHPYDSAVFPKWWEWRPRTPWICPQHHGWQSVVCQKSRQDMYGGRRRGRWTVWMSLDTVVLGGGAGGAGGGGGVGREWQM